MNITSLARADQMIPVSRARASLPRLVKELDNMDFFVLVKKYQPQAALVDLKFFSKLLSKYRQRLRQRDFGEVERDIANAVKAVRHAA